jgi:hypothetical protein
MMQMQNLGHFCLIEISLFLGFGDRSEIEQDNLKWCGSRNPAAVSNYAKFMQSLCRQTDSIIDCSM